MNIEKKAQLMLNLSECSRAHFLAMRYNFFMLSEAEKFGKIL